jgi:hypothetical protein
MVASAVVEQYRPHAYQADSNEHELGSEVPTRLPFTNILLSMSRIQEHFAHFREHCAHANGHHNGHHRIGVYSKLACDMSDSISTPFAST